MFRSCAGTRRLSPLHFERLTSSYLSFAQSNDDCAWEPEAPLTRAHRNKREANAIRRLWPSSLCKKEGERAILSAVRLGKSLTSSCLQSRDPPGPRNEGERN